MLWGKLGCIDFYLSCNLLRANTDCAKVVIFPVFPRAGLGLPLPPLKGDLDLWWVTDGEERSPNPFLSSWRSLWLVDNFRLRLAADGFWCERHDGVGEPVKHHHKMKSDEKMHVNFLSKHTVTYLPYSIHLGKKINVQSHLKVRSPRYEVYKCL